MAERGVGFIQPRGQSDSSRHAVDLGDRESLVRENKVRSDHFRNFSRNPVFALIGYQFGRLAPVQEIRNPRMQAAFCAEPVELFAGAEEQQQPVTELFDFFLKFCVQRKRAGRNPPFLFVKQSTLRQGIVDCSNAFLRIHERIFRA